MATRSEFKMSAAERRIRRFSDSFKVLKVRKIEMGKTKASDICKQYEVSAVNVYRWMNKFGTMKTKKERLIVEPQSDILQLIALKKKIAELERIVGQKQVLLDFKDKMIDLAEEVYGVDIKKKIQFHTLCYYWQHRENFSFSMNTLYKSIGISKQSFHQKMDRMRESVSEQKQLLVLIYQIREDHPTMGCRDMYYKLKPQNMGRDAFEAFCKEEGLSVPVVRNGRRTTDSTGVVRFDNFLNGLSLTRINQLWQSDITYYDIDGIFYYITFILDAYSRRILGHHCSQRLLAEHTTLPALEKALRQRKEHNLEGLIFHSDGGGKYYDKAFLQITAKYNITNSMCEYAWENGKAERIKRCFAWSHQKQLPQALEHPKL